MSEPRLVSTVANGQIPPVKAGVVPANRMALAAEKSALEMIDKVAPAPRVSAVPLLNNRYCPDPP